MMLKRRNPVAKAPLLNKGGVHQKSKSALRKKAKQALAREVRDLKRAQDAPEHGPGDQAKTAFGSEFACQTTQNKTNHFPAIRSG